MKRVIFYFLFIIALLSNHQILAQSTKSWSDAYDYVQNQRDEVSRLFDHKPFAIDSIQKGIKILESTLEYLDQPLIIDLANGKRFLRSRRLDVYADLATGNALMKNKERTISSIKKMMTEDATVEPVLNLLADTLFDFIREETSFKEVVKTITMCGSVFKNNALLTPYSENLSNEEKIAGLSLFWSEVKSNFVYFDHLPQLDWNKVYLEYLPKVQNTKTTLEYYRVMQEMCALLKDGHTNVYPPKELEDSVYARPPMRAGLIEDRVIILKVLSDSLMNNGIYTGLEIFKIDGMPVKSYAGKFVKPYQSSSTNQDLELRTYNYALLTGKIDQPIELELKDENDNIIKKMMTRGGYKDIKSRPLFEFRMLGENISYVSLNSFNQDTVAKMFDNSFEDISKSGALIIDMRNNGGGSGPIGFKILSYLTDQEFKSSARMIRASYNDLSWSRFPIDSWNPNGKKYYSKPVVVLIGNATFSAAEDFCVAFNFMKRGKLIGEPTGGSTGQPYSFSLPGGLTARVCAKRDTYPDGKEFVGIGIQPDILVKPTVKDIRNNRDAILEKALEYLRNILKK